MLSVSDLFEPLIARDLEAIPTTVRRFREEHSSEDLWKALAHFAVSAFAPSQHSKHALLCVVAAEEMREELGARYDDLLIECGVYAAGSRQPWSEPPLPDPPAIEPCDGDRHEIQAAIADGDRLRGERWLAARMKKSDLATEFLRVASDDLSDMGHKLIVGVAVWKLAQRFPQQSFAVLRVAIDEWTSYRERPDAGNKSVEGEDALVRRLIGQHVAQEGSAIAFHDLVLLDAALEAVALSGDASIGKAVRSHLSRGRTEPAIVPPLPVAAELPVYRLARDYGEYLKSFTIARRLKQHYPKINVQPVIDAAKFNLDHAPSFEEWSLA